MQKITHEFVLINEDPFMRKQAFLSFFFFNKTIEKRQNLPVLGQPLGIFGQIVTCMIVLERIKRIHTLWQFKEIVPF